MIIPDFRGYIFVKSFQNFRGPVRKVLLRYIEFNFGDHKKKVYCFWAEIEDFIQREFRIASKRCDYN